MLSDSMPIGLKRNIDQQDKFLSGQDINFSSVSDRQKKTSVKRFKPSSFGSREETCTYQTGFYFQRIFGIAASAIRKIQFYF